MQVTKTIKTTEWSFQAIHANEVAATVGEGLLFGFIYFRHNYDMVQDGETVILEKHYVELSDGTIHELRSVIKSFRISIDNKVEIVNDGISEDGTVCLQVFGKTSVGVGVSRILRAVTVQYDDGRTPILGDVQLEEVIQQLREDLTQSMKDTAQAVKDDIMVQLNSKITDVRSQLTTEIANQVGNLKSTVEGHFRDADAKYERRFSDLEASIGAGGGSGGGSPSVPPVVELDGLKVVVERLVDSVDTLKETIGNVAAQSAEVSRQVALNKVELDNSVSYLNGYCQRLHKYVEQLQREHGIA